MGSRARSQPWKDIAMKRRAERPHAAQQPSACPVAMRTTPARRHRKDALPNTTIPAQHRGIQPSQGAHTYTQERQRKGAVLEHRRRKRYGGPRRMHQALAPLRCLTRHYARAAHYRRCATRPMEFGPPPDKPDTSDTPKQASRHAWPASTTPARRTAQIAQLRAQRARRCNDHRPKS